MKDSNKTAFISEYENISKTYGDVNNDVNNLVKQLYHLDLHRGDVVGIWSCNSYSWVISNIFETYLLLTFTNF